jgi:hypothetical protein
MEIVNKTWTKAGLGESMWKDIWAEHYTDVITMSADVFKTNPMFNISPTEARVNAETSAEVDSRNDQRTEEVTPIDPITNKVVEEAPQTNKETTKEIEDAPLNMEKEISNNSNKIATADTKGNFSSVQYEIDREKTDDGYESNRINSEKGIPTLKEDTHLNPKANYLCKFKEDVFKLKIGENIYQVDYDHSTGKFTEKQELKSNSNIFKFRN